jgi:hypothetical protein
MHDNAPLPAAGPHLHQIRRLYVALGLIVVALLLLGALIVIRQHDPATDTSNQETFTPAPSSLITSLAQIPSQISNAVGVTTPAYPVTPLRGTSAHPVWQDSSGSGAAKPVVFFYGAEFSPYAAAGRWPLVIALSRFGTFTQLGQATSAGSEVFSGLSGFTFWHVTYASRWVTFDAVERYGTVDPTGARYVSLQHTDSVEAAAVAVFDPAGTFPLLDVANRYVLAGSSFSPTVLADLSSSEIAANLAYPTNPVTQALVTAANEVTAAICTQTGQQPEPVCAARGVQAADQRMGIKPAG